MLRFPPGGPVYPALAAGKVVSHRATVAAGETLVLDAPIGSFNSLSGPTSDVPSNLQDVYWVARTTNLDGGGLPALTVAVSLYIRLDQKMKGGFVSLVPGNTSTSGPLIGGPRDTSGSARLPIFPFAGLRVELTNSDAIPAVMEAQVAWSILAQTVRVADPELNSEKWLRNWQADLEVLDARDDWRLLEAALRGLKIYD